MWLSLSALCGVLSMLSVRNLNYPTNITNITITNITTKKKGRKHEITTSYNPLFTNAIETSFQDLLWIIG